MSITTGWFARIGPWPPSCGSTAWSPGAQIVCAGTKPSAIMRVLTTERRSSAVKRRPSRTSQPARMRHALSASIPASKPASAARSEASIARTSRGCFSSRCGQNGSGSQLQPDPLAAELLREPERKAARHAHAPQALAPQHARDHVGGRRAAAALLERRRELGPRQHAVDRRLLARPVHLEVAHHQDAGAAPLDEQERVGREETRRIEEVGVGLGGGVDQPAGRRLRHLRCRRRR